LPGKPSRPDNPKGIILLITLSTTTMDLPGHTITLDLPLVLSTITLDLPLVLSTTAMDHLVLSITLDHPLTRSTILDLLRHTTTNQDHHLTAKEHSVLDVDRKVTSSPSARKSTLTSRVDRSLGVQIQDDYVGQMDLAFTGQETRIGAKPLNEFPNQPTTSL
jgi:hypothetical protein